MLKLKPWPHIPSGGSRIPPWCSICAPHMYLRGLQHPVSGSQLRTCWCVSVQETAASLLWPAGVADPVSPPQGGGVHMQKQPASGFVTVDEFSSPSQKGGFRALFRRFVADECVRHET